MNKKEKKGEPTFEPKIIGNSQKSEKGKQERNH